MYSARGFEGDYRRRPQQNLSGASRKDGKHELVQKAQHERKKRKELRLLQEKATLIQAAFRSYVVRRDTKNLLRQEFDMCTLCLSEDDKFHTITLKALIRQTLFFYERRVDDVRLRWITLQVLKNYQVVLEFCSNEYRFQWQWYIIRILHLNLNIFEEFAITNNDQISTPANLFQIYTDQDILTTALGGENYSCYMDRLFRYVIARGYYKTVRRILEMKVPEPLMKLPSSRPPIPLAGLLFHMMTLPFCVMGLDTSMAFRDFVMQHFCSEILCPEITPVIRLFVLPALLTYEDFPFEYIIMTFYTYSFIPSTSYALYMFLILDRNQSMQRCGLLPQYLETLAKLSYNILKLSRYNSSGIDKEDDDDDDDDDDDMLMPSSDLINNQELEILQECLLLINDPVRVTTLITDLGAEHRLSFIRPFMKFLHNLAVLCPNAISEYELLARFAMVPCFHKRMWDCVTLLDRHSQFSQAPTLLDVLANGLMITDSEAQMIVPCLAIFAMMFKYYLSTLTDEEFFSHTENEDSVMPFSICELVMMSKRLRDVVLGLIEMAFPETLLCDHNQWICGSTYNIPVWAHLFNEIVGLLRQLHMRDVRHPYTPEGHWLNPNVIVLPKFLFNRCRILNHRLQPFQNSFTLKGINLEETDRSSVYDLRLLVVLKEIPFTISFYERLSVIHGIINKEKLLYQNPATYFVQFASVYVNIRRDYLYEDAFEKLSFDVVPELKLPIRIHFTSSIGVEEPGVDGGGIFREFLTDLLRTAFDPSRGFFLLTNDNQLYPNPNVHILHPDYYRHYHFIGRMLGKAVFENLLIELPFADFFIAKLTGSYSELNLHNLASLDPEIYKNLLYLRKYNGDFNALGLDFTLVVDEYGSHKTVELKPKGSEIPVAACNKMEYIHLVADYKLNKQIDAQCVAFEEGLNTMLKQEWLAMFSSKELQIILSGFEVPIDLSDLQEFAVYTGGFTLEHPNIQAFWRVVNTFNDEQIRDLLKFVTSLTRAPLLGFKDLDPPFCIQYVEGGDSRLPTASTCMNLLKLPVFTNDTVMREKLLFVINSGAGFDLS